MALASDGWTLQVPSGVMPLEQPRPQLPLLVINADLVGSD